MDITTKVKLAKDGDDNAFYELINESKAQLYKTAYAYVKNKEDALDIVSETVYKAYISLKKLNNIDFFNTWLIRILINTSMDYIRKNSKVVSIENYFDSKNITTAQTEQAKTVNTAEELMDLREAVDKLEIKYKTIVILKYFQDMKLTEIAEVLQCPLGTVKTNLNKALKVLRIDLKEELI